MLRKQHLEPVLKHNNTREKEVNELIHSNLCGPLPHASLSRSKYFPTFTDDCSQKNWTYFLKVKSETFEKFKVFKRMIENHGRKRIKILRTNKGGEFLSKESTAFREQSGIQKQLTISYTPHQNGVAKRKNRTILERARNMAIESNCP
jgi:transposase InsO family protein